MIDTKIQFLGFKESQAVSENIRNHIETIEKINNRITSCHVIVSRPHRKLNKGNIFQIKLRFHLPGSTIVVDRDAGNNHAHEDIYVAIRDSFWAAKRKIEDYTEKQLGYIKEKSKQPHAKIVRLLPADECGFIQTPDFREIYFHRNSIVNGSYEELQLGQEVRFSETMGDQGPQATSLHLIGHSGHFAGK